MVLLFNVFLTNSRANEFVICSRGNLPNSNKLEVTKYSLASLSKAFNWTRAIINVELDPKYYNLKDELEIKEFTHQEFQGIDLIYSNKRNELQEEWKKTYNDFNSDLIFYLGNHDHIFIDSSVEYLKLLTKLPTLDKYSTVLKTKIPSRLKNSPIKGQP